MRPGHPHLSHHPGPAASIESESPVSGHPIRVSVGENGVTSVQPETAVVSLVNPDDLTSIRSSFCNQVHYFTCAQDAAPWLAEHPKVRSSASLRPTNSAQP
nr:organomercurial lyase [Mycolicibacterium mucogenicum]